VKTLITGASGQLGRDLVGVYAGDDVAAPTHADLDISDRDSVLQAITTVRPDVIVHSAAWTAVDACESDPERAYALNALGSRYIAEGAKIIGAHMIYLSTDYVFDGLSDRPYTEWDATNPLSVYGRSKLGGELETKAATAWTIVRTSWVCGVHGSNMVKTVLRLASERDQLAFVDDQHGCPTFTDDLARAIRRLAAGRITGVFHVTNQGATTWFQFARDVLAPAGLDPERVSPIATADLQPPRPAPRPANSVLDNVALRHSGLGLLPDHHETLERTVKELLSS